MNRDRPKFYGTTPNTEAWLYITLTVIFIVVTVLIIRSNAKDVNYLKDHHCTLVSNEIGATYPIMIGKMFTTRHHYKETYNCDFGPYVIRG